jgi:hypothetical protein
MHEYRKNTMKDLIEEVNPKKNHMTRIRVGLSDENITILQKIQVGKA